MANLGTAVIRVTLDKNELTRGLENARRQVENTAQQASASLGDIGRTLSGIGGTVTVAFAGVKTAALAAFSAIDNANATIARGTGATGEALRRLRGDFEAVFAQVPQSAQQVATAIADINTRLGLTGQELQQTARLFLDFARINDTDVATATTTVSRLINALGLDASEAADLLDKLTFAAQRTGISAVGLAQLITEAGPAFEELGFGINESIALFSEFERAGARPQEVVSTLNIVLTRMAREGATDARTAFSQLLESIRDAPTLMDSVRIAADAFGARFGAKIAEDIRAGRFEIDEMVASLENARGTVERTTDASATFGERLAQLRNQITLALNQIVEAGNIGDRFLNVLSRLIDGVSAVARAFSRLPEPIQDVLVTTTTLTAFIAGPLLLALGKLIAALIQLKAIITGGALLSGFNGLAVAATASKNAFLAKAPVLLRFAGPAGILAAVGIGAVALSRYMQGTTEVVDQMRTSFAMLERTLLNYREGLVITTEEERVQAVNSLQITRERILRQMQMINDYAQSVVRINEELLRVPWFIQLFRPGDVRTLNENSRILDELGRQFNILARSLRDVDADIQRIRTMPLEELAREFPRIEEGANRAAGAVNNVGGAIERIAAGTSIVQLRTVADVFEDLARAGTLAERRAAAFGNTLEAQAESIRTRLRLIDNAIDELLAMGLAPSDDRISYLVGRLEALNAELANIAEAQAAANVYVEVQEQIADATEGAAAAAEEAQKALNDYINTLDRLRAAGQVEVARQRELARGQEILRQAEIRRQRALREQERALREAAAAERELAEAALRRLNVEGVTVATVANMANYTSLMERAQGEVVRFTRAQIELGRATREDLAQALQEQVAAIERLLTAFGEGSERWYELVNLLSRARAELARIASEAIPEQDQGPDQEQLRLAAIAYQRELREQERALREVAAAERELAQAALQRLNVQGVTVATVTNMAGYVSLMDQAQGAVVRFTRAQIELGRATREELAQALQGQINAIERLLGVFEEGSERWYNLVDLLARARRELAQIAPEVVIPTPDATGIVVPVEVDVEPVDNTLRDLFARSAVTLTQSIVSALQSGDIRRALDSLFNVGASLAQSLLGGWQGILFGGLFGIIGSIFGSLFNRPAQRTAVTESQREAARPRTAPAITISATVNQNNQFDAGITDPAVRAALDQRTRVIIAELLDQLGVAQLLREARGLA